MVFQLPQLAALATRPVSDLTYDYEYLGAGPETLNQLVSGEGKFFGKLKRAKRPMIIVGQGTLARKDGAGILSKAAKLAEGCGAAKGDWNGFNILHTAAGRVAGLDLGLVPGDDGHDVTGICAGAESGEIDVVFLLGADEVSSDKLGDAFVVYQGTHGDRGAHCADVILPGAAYTEKSGTYVNTEGRVQMASRAAFPPGDAREDWAILRALSDRLGNKLPYDDLPALRAAMYEICPHLALINEIQSGDAGDIAKLAKKGGRLGNSAFPGAAKDFYLTNPIARASAVMSELSAMAAARNKGATGTNG